VALASSELQADEVRRLVKARPREDPLDEQVKTPAKVSKAKKQLDADITVADVEEALGLEAPLTPPAGDRPMEATAAAVVEKNIEAPAVKRMRLHTKSPGAAFEQSKAA